MCQFLGFVATDKDGEVDVYACDLVHHTRCESMYGLNPDTYYSFEWTSDNENDLQIKNGVSKSDRSEWVRGEILRLWPTRGELIQHLLSKMAGRVETLTIVPQVVVPKLVLPAGVKTAYLSGCTGLKSVELPAGVKTADLSGCTGLKYNTPAGCYIYK